MQALHLYEVSLCPCGCGQPARLSQDDSKSALWSKERRTCYARVELERGEKDRKPEPGEMRWVEFDLPWPRGR